MITINDIAKELGVAKSTISNALTNNRYVNPELKNKILQKCKEMNFTPNFYATSLSKNMVSQIVGLFLESGGANDFQSFYPDLIKSCLINAAEESFNVLVYYGLNEENTNNLLGIGRAPIDGAILLSPEIVDMRADKIAENKIPIVYIGNPSNNNEVSYVDIDTNHLICSVVKKMVSVNRCEFVFINSKKDLTVSRDREVAYQSIIDELGLTKKSVIFNATHSKESEGEEIVNSLIGQKKSFNAIICANDLLAKGVYDALNKNSLLVGKEVSVFALGGGKYIDSLLPKLSYAYQDYEEIGKIAIELLLEKIINKNDAPKKKICKSKIYFKESI